MWPKIQHLRQYFHKCAYLLRVIYQPQKLGSMLGGRWRKALQTGQPGADGGRCSLSSKRTFAKRCWAQLLRSQLSSHVVSHLVFNAAAKMIKMRV